MATCTVRFIQRGFHSIMFIEEVRAVVGRFQRGNIVVTFFAGKRGIDFVVADQAIGHLREYAGGRDILGLLDPVVAPRATVGGVEMARGSERQILLGGDRSPQNGRDSAELRVHLVIETVHFSGARSFYHATIGVARHAHRRRGQIVVRRCRALRDGLMTRRAGELQRQMPPVRERFVLRSGGICQKYGCD